MYYGQLYQSGNHVVEVFYKGEPGTYGNFDVSFEISASSAAQALSQPPANRPRGGIPFFNASCAQGVDDVRADQGGPIQINGNEGAPEISNENYYEASYGNVTISLAINPDGSPNVSATWRGRRQRHLPGVVVLDGSEKACLASNASLLLQL